MGMEWFSFLMYRVFGNGGGMEWMTGNKRRRDVLRVVVLEVDAGGDDVETGSGEDFPGCWG